MDTFGERCRAAAQQWAQWAERVKGESDRSLAWSLAQQLEHAARLHEESTLLLVEFDEAVRRARAVK